MYKLLQSITGESDMVQRLSDCRCIPFDDGNRDYREFLAWKDAGNVPEPADAVPKPEEVITTDDKLDALIDAVGFGDMKKLNAIKDKAKSTTK